MRKFALFICLSFLLLETKVSAQPSPQNQNPVQPPPAMEQAPQAPQQIPSTEVTPSQPTTTQAIQTPAQTSGQAPGQQAPGQIPPAQQAVNPLPPEMMDPLLDGFFEDIGYNPSDRRDPFLPYLSPSQRLAQGPGVILEPLQKYALAQLKVVGIIWDVGKPKALILDPQGTSHIVVENSKIGQEMGYVAAIREGEVIVVEQQISAEGKKSFQTKIMKLNSTSITSGT